MINDRTIHCAQHAIRHVGWSWNLEKVSSCVNHESSLTSLLLFRFAHPRFRFAHPGLKSRAGSRAALRSRWGLILAVAPALLLPLREFGESVVLCESLGSMRFVRGNHIKPLNREQLLQGTGYRCIGSSGHRKKIRSSCWPATLDFH